MNVIFFGGSFNPVHIGHVFAVCYLSSVYKPNKIIVVPVYKHVFGKKLESFEHRYEMCQLSMGWFPNVIISPIEKEIGTASVTAKTIKLLKESNPDWNIKFAIGTDSAEDLKAGKWYDSEALLQIAEPLIIHRSTSSHTTHVGKKRSLDPVILPPISSTEIRASLKGQLSDKIAKAYLPHDVAEYIKKHALYEKSPS